MLCLVEYLALNQQLDNLNTVLDVLERRSDHIQEEAKKLIREAREARQNSSMASNGDKQEDSQSGEDSKKEEAARDGVGVEEDKEVKQDSKSKENTEEWCFKLLSYNFHPIICFVQQQCYIECFYFEWVKWLHIYLPLNECVVA